MDPTEQEASPELRTQLARIRELYGQIVPSAELQGEIKGFGSQKGIYKPAGSVHALWIRQTAKGIYPDKDLEPRPDGSWTYRYSPEGRDGKADLTLDTNRALMRSIDDRVPVGVFRQATDIDGRTAYEVLGLAMVESYDGEHFILRGEGIDVEVPPVPETIIPTFEPFEGGPVTVTGQTRVLRERRFGVVIRQLYHERCSLCNLGFRVKGRPIAVEAAHIIPVEERGRIADVRNGILLCRNHHALFDQSAWTMDEDLRVRVAPDKDLRASAVANHILDWEGKRLPNLPTLEIDYPATAAIRWRLESFERTWS